MVHKITINVGLDLKAFERRLTEVIACLNPSTLRWRSKNCVVYLFPPGTFLWPAYIYFVYVVVLTIMSISTSVGAWYWLTDPKTSVVPLTESLLNHPIFTCATLLLSMLMALCSYQSGSKMLYGFSVLLFVIGIHKLVIAPQILTSRTRSVLNDFNMSCDDTGKLILKPRPNN